MAQALLLAFPGVLLQVLITGTCLRYLVGAFSADGEPWDWDLSMMLASITSATDPVAVVAALHALGAPEKLSDLIDGEALWNDGSAYVLVLIFQINARTEGEGHSIGSGILFFVTLALGGVATGLASFRVVIFWLEFIERDWRAEVGVLLLAIYGTFAIAELVAHVSGVLAVVTLGSLMAKRGQYAFSPDAAGVVESAGGVLSYVSETLIFFVAGVATWAPIARRGGLDWALVFVLYAVLFVSRTCAGTHAAPARVVSILPRTPALCAGAVVIGSFQPLIGRMGYKPTLKEAVVVIWAGLRGAVGLALSLLVSNDTLIAAEDRDRVQFVVAGVTMLTLVINSPTTPALFEALRLYPANPCRSVVVEKAVNRLEGPVTEEIKGILCALPGMRKEVFGGMSAMGCDFLFKLADWDVVMGMVPNFTGTVVQANNRLSLGPRAGVHLFDWGVVRAAVKAVHEGPMAVVPPAVQRTAPPLGSSGETESDEERCEVVVELFAVLRHYYALQRDAKQIDGPALAVVIEAVSAGEEVLLDQPTRTTAEAFQVEFEVLSKELKAPDAGWHSTVNCIPLLGPMVTTISHFQRTYEATEALAAFIRAHEALGELVAKDERRARLAAGPIDTVVAEAKHALLALRASTGSVAFLQINLLTARAAVEMKLRAMEAIVHEGYLTPGDRAQLDACFSRALYRLDTARYAAAPASAAPPDLTPQAPASFRRYSPLAPIIFHRRVVSMTSRLPTEDRHAGARGPPVLAS